VSVFADVATLPGLQIWDGVVGRTVQGEKLTLVIVELEAGSVIPEHSHENEQVGVCLAGSLRFRVGAETSRVRPGHTWRILADTPHEVATGPEGAVVVETFSPVRADWEALDRVEAPPTWP
jgi:quercetin dioxygenase-like cupin family protein